MTWQSKHVDFPGFGWYRPASHVTHSIHPDVPPRRSALASWAAFAGPGASVSGPRVPAGHAAHTAGDTAPVASEKRPDAHAVQAALPVSLAKRPATHPLHVAAPSPEEVPAAHGVHGVAAPMSGWNKPAAHGAQLALADARV